MSPDWLSAPSTGEVPWGSRPVCVCWHCTEQTISAFSAFDFYLLSCPILRFQNSFDRKIEKSALWARALVDCCPLSAYTFDFVQAAAALIWPSLFNSNKSPNFENEGPVVVCASVCVLSFLLVYITLKVNRMCQLAQAYMLGLIHWENTCWCWDWDNLARGLLVCVMCRLALIKLFAFSRCLVASPRPQLDHACTIHYLHI